MISWLSLTSKVVYLVAWSFDLFIFLELVTDLDFVGTDGAAYPVKWSTIMSSTWSCHFLPFPQCHVLCINTSLPWCLLVIFLQQRSGSELHMASLQDEHDSEASQAPEYCIDAGSIGNIARFINHSCQPNLFIQCVLSSHRDIKLAKIMLVAADTIPPLQASPCDKNLIFFFKEKLTL